MVRLKKYIKPYLLFILLTLAVKFAGTTAELFIPDLMETILDEKIKLGTAGPIFVYGGFMLLCAVLAMGLNILANRMSAVSAGKVTRQLRHDLFEKLEKMSSAQMRALTVSSAESRLTSDTYNVNQLLARVQRIGVRAPILLLGGIFMMLKMDAFLSLILIALLPIICLTVYLVTRKTIPLYQKVQDIQDDMVQVCQENFTGIRVIKALSKTEYEKSRFNKVNDYHSHTGLKAGLINNITNPVNNIILYAGLILVIVIGAYRVNTGNSQPGVIVAFIQYFTMILNATLTITRIFIMWSKGEASANRIADVLDLPEDMVLEPEHPAGDNSHHIEFKDVTFSYTGKGANVTNLNFTLEHGQTLGIIGPTGCGKTVLLNLLMRLYDTNEGQVFIDGRDVRTIPFEELRSKFGVVFQNDFIMQGTIRENIRFFRDIPDGELSRAASAAQAEFIGNNAAGMDFEVAIRGNNLSGGQRQRLLIARALAGNPEILILDDSSSALDYQTDANLRQALRKEYRNTTTLVIAQRVSSLKHADLILVIEDSHVIGAGTHEELLQSCEEYRIIAETQMGEGKEEA